MIKPLHDLVAVKVKAEVRETEGGILTVSNLDADRPTRGKILAVGPGLYGDDGEREELQVAVGDTAMFAREAGIDYTDDEHGEIKLIHEAEIIAIVG